MAVFTILYGNYYPPHREFELIFLGKFSRRTWVNFTQQYGKNRHQRYQQNKFTMLYGNYCYILTVSSHTEYVKRKIIVIAWVKKKEFSPFDECSCFVWQKDKTSTKNFPSVYLSVCLVVWLYGNYCFIFTYSSHTEYVKRESIVIACQKKKILSFWRMFMFCMTKRQNKHKKFSVCLSVWLSGCTYVDFSCGHNNFRWS